VRRWKSMFVRVHTELRAREEIRIADITNTNSDEYIITRAHQELTACTCFDCSQGQVDFPICDFRNFDRGAADRR
jgi:hypothetical protein